LEDPNNELTSSTRFVLHQLIELDKPIEKVTDYLIAYAKQIPAYQLLIAMTDS
jgi:hypothetical protein